ncbi:hypothetical protein [Brevundimonas sp. G8]|uniref:hypothetical protein n=1 Tax=unclassified Brevundimonas TaxID=2622653 RepID=UPI0012F2DC6B|nr:hypothetical protein [Brevundimonas sp. G8]VXA90497.1 conserved hypothetical protein [Brevundimonas sp. G8]
MATARSENTSATEFRSDIEAAAFPTREYIGAMALEMARLARDEGDVRLAGMLEQVAGVAGHPPA